MILRSLLVLLSLGLFAWGCSGGQDAGRAYPVDDDDSANGSSDDDDATVDDGYGTLSGDCGVLDGAELGSDLARLFRNAINFGANAYDPTLLGDGAREVLDEGNLGGSSLESEAIAFEVLDRCEAAVLLKTEAEIVYQDSGGKKTDLLVEIQGETVGVSVTRAFHFPPEEPYTEAEAESLLSGKLDDVLLSADNASAADAWERSMLHVIAYDADYADSIEAAYGGLDASVTADTLVLVTVTDGEDAYLY